MGGCTVARKPVEVPPICSIGEEALIGILNELRAIRDKLVGEPKEEEDA